MTIPGEDTPRERAFAIRIKWAATVDIKAVVDFVRWAHAQVQASAGRVSEFQLWVTHDWLLGMLTRCLSHASANTVMSGSAGTHPGMCP